MIVHRMTFYIKPGHIEEARALALAEIKRVNWHRPIRLYTSRMGRFNTLATENDFANLAEYEQYWNDWFATPAARTCLEKWDTLVEPGGAEELWDLAT